MTHQNRRYASNISHLLIASTCTLIAISPGGSRRRTEQHAEDSFMATYTLPELPYDYAELEPVISPEIIELHHDKHHAAYVKGANDTLEQLAEARDKETWGAINGLEKNLAFHLSGHILHSVYWHNMTGDGGGEPLEKDGTGELADAIAESFGSFARFKAQLTKAAATTPGLRLGRSRLGAGQPAPDRRADLRPPGQRRPGLHPDPRLRRLGARLLPPVQEPEGRLHRSHVARRELAGCGQALHRREAARRQPAARPLRPRALTCPPCSSPRPSRDRRRGTSGGYRLPRTAVPRPLIRTAVLVAGDHAAHAGTGEDRSR
jgi:hypothetical protein